MRSPKRSQQKNKSTENGVDLDARTRVIDAAGELFSRDGFRRTSMDAIAESARTSKRTLYANFVDKHAVLEAVLSEFSARRLDAISRLSARSPSPRARLVALAEDLRASALDDYALGMYRVLIAEADHLPKIAEKSHRTGVQQISALFREPLESLGVQDCETIGRLLYDLLVLAPTQRRLVGAADDLIDSKQIFDLILNGAKRR